jgi:hypothetical protein
VAGDSNVACGLLSQSSLMPHLSIPSRDTYSKEPKMLSDQEKAELRQQLKANQHEVFVVSFEEMDAIVRSSKS